MNEPSQKYTAIAYKILKETKIPLSNIEIADIALGRGDLSEEDGKTPEASLSAAIYRNIRNGKDDKSKIVFVKLAPNLFGLTEWDYKLAFEASKMAEHFAQRIKLGNY